MESCFGASPGVLSLETPVPASRTSYAAEWPVLRTLASPYYRTPQQLQPAQYAAQLQRLPCNLIELQHSQAYTSRSPLQLQIVPLSTDGSYTTAAVAAAFVMTVPIARLSISSPSSTSKQRKEGQRA
jgi:hypothetical protein